MTHWVLEDPRQLEGIVVGKYKLEEYIGRGTIGVVYRAVREDIHDTVACKLIPQGNLKKEWETELEKVSKLDGIEQVVSYRIHGTETIKGELFVYVFWQFIKGRNLRDYIKTDSSIVTISFIWDLIYQILQVFVAMEEVRIVHGDLHEGNILIADPDPRFYEQSPRIKITDFGIGYSKSPSNPLDDYTSLAGICYRLLDHIDPSTLNGKERFLYNRLISFLDKEILERDYTVADYVRNPRLLIGHLRNFDQEYEDGHQAYPKVTLKHPFDYMSCEQIGDDFKLLRELYSLQFLGNRDLVERTNTVLTGPRGCGKTTIFRNLSLKTQLLAGGGEINDEYIGIYYQCKDLYYPFSYLEEKLSPDVLKITVHYFNLALLLQILDTLVTIEQVSWRTFSEESLVHLEGFIKAELPSYQIPPKGTSKLRHMFNTVQREKSELKKKLESGQYNSILPEGYLGLDFLRRFCGFLQETIPWLKNRPFYFFVDDYSLPKISKPLQLSLNRVIFDRCAECFFKISTESVVSLYPYDADGKFLDEVREYDLIDLGDYFLHNKKERRRFLLDVINNRLEKAEGISPEYKKFEGILGKTPYKYNDLAREIADGKHIHYHGIDTIIDLCSGDIGNILRLLRDIFAQVDGGLDAFSKQGGVKIPIGPEIQDKAIREFGADFLNRIESFPGTGPQLRKITEAFGDVAHWYLCNRTSKNVKGKPQWQAFRIEIRGKLKFDDPHSRDYYDDLLRYGLFIRDVKGKSIRGAVVPRLYLRRILIPTFRLTFNQRDNVGLEVKDFNTLLNDPEKFTRSMKTKARIPEEQRRIL
jgi:serine/threonine protein kinase